MPTVTLKGTPVKLLGEPVSVGQKAPDFKVQALDLSDYTLSTDAGKTRIFCALPSLYTGVCDMEMRRFNQEAAKLPNTVVVAISMDSPFAMKQWCGAADAGNIKAVSDHREASFGRNYGCLVSGGGFDRLLCRAVFVVGPDDKVKHVEYVPEIGTEPNYDAALAAAR